MRQENLRASMNRLGPWVDHNIRLAPDLATRGVETGLSIKIRHVMEVLLCLLRSSTLRGYSILDLGCLEGGYAIEAALLGARVVGIEGREVNLLKCLFVKETLGIPNVDFRLGDVRSISGDKVDVFDVVLCLGLLYHLDDPFTFLKKLPAMCRAFSVLDTHIAYEDERAHAGVSSSLRERLSPLVSLKVDEETFEGRYYREFPLDTPPEVKQEWAQSSLGNELSFWPTKTSLLRMLAGAGFRQVWEYHVLSDGEPWSTSDFARILLAASTQEIKFHSRLWDISQELEGPSTPGPSSGRL